MMGKPSRDKGKRGERELAAIVRDAGFPAVRRGQQYHGGADSPDVTGLPGVHIEVKRVERLNLTAAMEQSIGDAAADEMPCLAHRSDRQPWKMTMLLDDWLALYKAGGFALRDPETGSVRPSYGELYTLNCKLRDEIAALTAKNAELFRKLQQLEGGHSSWADM
jgi:Holliday junction resolvase